jgi:hypothetical protein
LFIVIVIAHCSSTYIVIAIAIVYHLGVIWEISFWAFIIWELFIVDFSEVSCLSLGITTTNTAGNNDAAQPSGIE